MKQFIGCDAHKKYSVFVAMDENGKKTKPIRVPHDLETCRKFLSQLPERSHIAVEATGHWYWIVDEMERARHIPHLTDALEAKKRVGKTHKSDPIDAGGLSLLLRCGTPPEVWIPPAVLRDQHELPNVCPKDYGQLSETARRTLRRMRRRPRLVTAFWKQASLWLE